MKTSIARLSCLLGLALLSPAPLAPAQPVDTGGTARNFTLRNRATGQPVSLHDFAGRIVVLDFFAYWCPPCQASSPELEQNIQRYYDARGGNPSGIPVVVIEVNVESANPALTDAFVRQVQATLAADDLQLVAYQQFLVGQNAIPRFVIINGTANSTSHRPWEVVKNALGWGGANNIASFRQLIDNVRVPPPAPVFAAQAQSVTVAAGGPAEFSAPSVTAGVTYQWHHDGAVMPGANGPTLIVPASQPADAGIYQVMLASPGGTTTSQPAILGLATAAKLVGAGAEVGTDIQHPNGNIYDQVLLTGAAVTVTADPGQVTRISFIDLTDDIVQVEFAGAGTLSLVLANPSGPAAPENYNQAVDYMKGHAGIVIAGADESTNVSVFSVGRLTAVNQALFRSDVTYDGVADLAYLAISSANGKFGGVRTANASYFNTQGLTGLYAPNVQFTGPVFVGDIAADDAATPVLVLGAGADVRITGGDLLQTNSRAVQVQGIGQLQFTDGITSHSTSLPARANCARLEQDGTDVTAQIVLSPSP